MDRVREVSSKGKQPSLWMIVTAMIVVGIAITLATLDFGSQRIERKNLQIDTVKRGDLIIKVSGNGVLLPRNIEWIASRVEGRVSKIHRRAGAKVAAGELLLELNNPSLITASEEALLALEGAKAEKLSYSVDLENQLLNQKSVTIQARFAYEAAKLKLDAQTQLQKKTNIIAEIDYRRTQLEVEQLAISHEIEKERLEKSKANTSAQLAAKDAYVNQLQKALDRANDKLSALTISSSIDGVLQEMNLEVGQQLMSGSEIAKVAQQENLYAEIKILARQASEVLLGQKVLIDTRNGTVNGFVSRIDPTVTQGYVIVDVEISEKLPKGARPALQVEGVITLAELKDTLFVGKPGYSKNDSRISLYKLDGEYAQRIDVQTGQASVNHIQILNGLQAGDRIILSDSSDWQSHERVLVN